MNNPHIECNFLLIVTGLLTTPSSEGSRIVLVINEEIAVYSGAGSRGFYTLIISVLSRHFLGELPLIVSSPPPKKTALKQHVVSNV